MSIWLQKHEISLLNIQNNFKGHKKRAQKIIITKRQIIFFWGIKWINDLRRVLFHKARKQSTSLTGSHSLRELTVICKIVGQLGWPPCEPQGLNPEHCLYSTLISKSISDGFDLLFWHFCFAQILETGFLCWRIWHFVCDCFEK